MKSVSARWRQKFEKIQRSVRARHGTAHAMWDQHMSHMSASSCVCWYCIACAVPCRARTLLWIFKNFGRKRNLWHSTVMLILWMGLLWLPLDGTRVWLLLRGAAWVIVHGPSSILCHTHTCIALSMSSSLVRPLACRPPEATWTSQISLVLSCALGPSSRCGPAIEASWPGSILRGRRFYRPTLHLWLICL